MDDPAARSSLFLSPPLPSIAGHGNLSRRARASRCHGSLPLMILDIQHGINHCLCLSSAFFPFSFLFFFLRHVVRDAFSALLPFSSSSNSRARSSLRFIIVIIVNVVDRFLMFLKRSTLPFRDYCYFRGHENTPFRQSFSSLFLRNIRDIARFG